MAAAELANMGGLSTWIYPDADRRSEGTPEDALVPLWRGVRASCLAPLVTLPTIHALFLRRRDGMSEEVSRQRRRADALALIAEDSVRSYPSWISELSRKSPDGINRRRYAYEHLGAGEALEFVRGPTNSSSDHAVSYYHRAVHLGYVPKQHHWIADALDDGLRLAVIVENVKPGWLFRRRAKYVGTRIIVLYDGR